MKVMTKKSKKTSADAYKETVQRLLKDPDCETHEKDGTRIFRLKKNKHSQNEEKYSIIEDINRIIISHGLVLENSEGNKKTYRKRGPYRKATDTGVDLGKEENRAAVKLGARIPRNLKERFDTLAENVQDKGHGDLLTEAIEDLLNKYDHS